MKCKWLFWFLVVAPSHGFSQKIYTAGQIETLKAEVKNKIDGQAKMAQIMDEFRPKLRTYYYDETKYNTYLEQLGIKYPTLKAKS